MSKTLKLIISIIGTISGWLMAGIGFTVRLGHPINTILFLGGLGLMIFSGIAFIVLLITKSKN
ncbi:MAG: hypothetical protein ACK5UE_02425 [Chitinophagales bacterium]|jgi:hypothetical protein